MPADASPVLPFWKDKLLPSIGGALVGAVLTQAVALYSLNKNLEATQNRERIHDLRTSINSLHVLQSEMETNTKHLISERPELKFELDKKDIEVLSIKDPMVREFAKAYIGAEGEFYTLRSVVAPKELLSVMAWIQNGQLLPEPSFELSKDLNKFYVHVERANEAIIEIKNLFARWGRVFPEREVENLKRTQKQLADEIAYVSKDRITDLLSRVVSERKKLEEILARLDK